MNIDNKNTNRRNKTPKKIIDVSNKQSKIVLSQSKNKNIDDKNNIQMIQVLKKALKDSLSDYTKLHSEFQIVKEENKRLEALLSAANDEIEEKDEIILELYNIIESNDIKN